MGISGTAIKWFASYLENRTARVCVEGQFLEEDHLTRSVPQGSWLGPRLYSDYTQPLGALLKFLILYFHMYADDLQMTKSFNPASIEYQVAAKQQLEHGINEVSRWMKTIS